MCTCANVVAPEATGEVAVVLLMEEEENPYVHTASKGL